MKTNLKNIKIIAFDADDTLWVNEPNYRETEVRFCEILEAYISHQEIIEKLFETEMRNLKLFGYGAKGFMLSMIETALEISQFRISGKDIQKIIDLGKSLLQKPIEILEGVVEILTELQHRYPLLLLTKGDLLDQETKLARSGLADYFNHIEIVSDKTEETYRGFFKKLNIQPREFLMIGNSVKSDILPVINIGAQAIHIPFHTTWQYEEVAEENIKQNQFLRVESIKDILDLLPQMK
ncbi:MAG: HAD family hydrolase [Candidatus Brocadia sp. WS118]|nr:MAG: HAD family hydrolase [Candidatus Brocadia sp. WS118]